MQTEKVQESQIDVEITDIGIKRIVITTDPDDVDAQSAAHLLLAKITPQLLLLDAALKATNNGSRTEVKDEGSLEQQEQSEH
jgi:hypothetical protein